MRPTVGILAHPTIVDYRVTMIVDSAYTGSLILRGAVWMFLTLFWMSIAHYKAIKNRDYRLIMINIFFLLFCLMERPGLDVWYNFVLLYPLAVAFQQN